MICSSYSSGELYCTVSEDIEDWDGQKSGPIPWTVMVD